MQTLTHTSKMFSQVRGAEVDVVTTWHATRAEADARIAEVENTVFSGVFPGGTLGKFRAVTWA